MSGNKKKIRIGVLALQGDFAEHIAALHRADGDVEAYGIRYANQMLGAPACGALSSAVEAVEAVEAVDALVIPGGESTAIARLVDDGNDPLFAAIKQRGAAGMPIYGTCMGSIFLAKEIEGSKQGRLALMDITVKRNAFGPQRRSFETELDVPELGAEPFPAVFIRAPIVSACGPTVTVLASLSEGIVMARQGNLLVSAFHPEIVEDNRVHSYFVGIVRRHMESQDVAPALNSSSVAAVECR